MKSRKELLKEITELKQENRDLRAELSDEKIEKCSAFCNLKLLTTKLSNCQNCKHYNAKIPDEPCLSCKKVGGKYGTNWEAL